MTAHYDPIKCDEAQEKLQTVAATIRCFRNTFTPVHKLPAEIIAHILCCEIATSWRKSPHTWVRLTHVCRYWRNSALQFPSVWSKIPTSHEDAMQTLFSRSKAAELEVDLKIPQAYRMPARLAQFLVPFKENVARIAILSLHIGTESSQFWSHMRDLEAPNLRALAINMPYVDIGNTAKPIPIIFNNSLPLLKSIDVTGYTSWSVDHPFRNLISITLRMQCRAVAHGLLAFVDFLGQSPNLQRLTLFDAEPTRVGGIVPAPLRLTSLKSFTIGQRMGNIYTDLLPHLVLPNVVDIKMEVNENYWGWRPYKIHYDIAQLGDLQNISHVYLMSDRHEGLNGSRMVASASRTSLSITSRFVLL